jgi:hypothetical protein
MVQIRRIRGRKPEAKIQNDIIKYLRARDWFVRPTHGCAYQAGFPDLFAAKRRYGPRWIEVKNKTGYRFTEAQLRTFPQFSKNNVGVWVLNEATDLSYDKLFKPPNWAQFLQVAQVYARFSGAKQREEKPLKVAGKGPEREIQTAIVEALENDNWFVLETYGSLYQSGFPDVYACKKGEGQRWIEVKQPVGYKFTGRQLEVFPRMMAEGVGIWILTSDNLSPLGEKPNWTTYLNGASAS